MARTVAIGIQNFEGVIKGNYLYVDKTSFIKEWWESGDSVTLIARPRRFGKTTLSCIKITEGFQCHPVHIDVHFLLVTAKQRLDKIIVILFRLTKPQERSRSVSIMALCLD